MVSQQNTLQKNVDHHQRVHHEINSSQKISCLRSLHHNHSKPARNDQAARCCPLKVGEAPGIEKRDVGHQDDETKPPLPKNFSREAHASSYLAGQFCSGVFCRNSINLHNFMPRCLTTNQFDFTARPIQCLGQKPNQRFIRRRVHRWRGHFDPQLRSQCLVNFIARCARLQSYAKGHAVSLCSQIVRHAHNKNEYSRLGI
jgi:hypothetical protein